MHVGKVFATDNLVTMKAEEGTVRTASMLHIPSMDIYKY